MSRVVCQSLFLAMKDSYMMQFKFFSSTFKELSTILFYCLALFVLSRDILYGDFKKVRRAVGRPLLRYTNVCKRDMKLF